MLESGVCPLKRCVRPAPINPVTLNLFQGPSGRKRGAIGRGAHLTARLATQASGRGAKWTLKQVQGDDIGKAGLRG